MMGRIHCGLCGVAVGLVAMSVAVAQEPAPPAPSPAPDSVVAGRLTQLQTRLREEREADDQANPQSAQRRLDQLVTEAAQLVTMTGSERLRYDVLAIHLQSLHLRLTRWPAEAENERRLAELRAAARRLKAVRQPQAVPAGDFWLTTAELFEVQHSDLPPGDKQRQSEQVLRSFMVVHNEGPMVEAARAAMKKLIEQGVAASGGEETVIEPDATGPAPVEPSAEPLYTLGPRATGPDRVARVPIRCKYQRTENVLRILEPDRLAASDRPTRLLLVLPAEAGESGEFGDPIESLRALGAHNRYNLVVVCPTLSDTPWYGDHPTNLELRQGSYIIKAVLPAMRELYPQAGKRPLVLGFSRSGWGALSLLCRYPQIFEAAAVWDAPLMTEAPTLPGMESVFGTPENFAKYALPEQFRDSAKVFRKSKRIALLGYDFFLDPMQRAHVLLDELRVPHDYVEQPGRRHHWDSGWLPDALSRLTAMGSVTP